MIYQFTDTTIKYIQHINGILIGSGFSEEYTGQELLMCNDHQSIKIHKIY